MLGAKTSLGSQRCSASNGEALLKTATELIGIIQVKKWNPDCTPPPHERKRMQGGDNQGCAAGFTYGVLRTY
ncbi:hypothetical protein [Pseudomonas sp. ZS1P83]